MTPATQEKHAQFLHFMESVLRPETAVQAVVGIGSIATGRIRPDSDIDIILFLEPAVPLAAVARPSFCLARGAAGRTGQRLEYGRVECEAASKIR